MWYDLSRLALIGLDRGALSSENKRVIKEANIVGSDANEDEIFLAGIIYYSNLQKSGYQPLTLEEGMAMPIFISSDDGIEELMPTVAAPFFSQILGGIYAGALLEFLCHIIKNKQVLLPEFLAEVLQYGEKNKQLVPYLQSSVGNIGYWLATQNHNWGYLSKDKKNIDFSFSYSLDNESVMSIMVAIKNAATTADFDYTAFQNYQKMMATLKYNIDPNLYDTCYSLFSDLFAMPSPSWFRWHKDIKDFLDTLKFRKSFIYALNPNV